MNKKEMKLDTCLHSFVLLGKHSSNDGRGRKSGEAGFTVCFLLLVFSKSAVLGPTVDVALGTELLELGHTFFSHIFETHPTTSNPAKNAVLGNLGERFPFLQATEVKPACMDAISGKSNW